MKETTNSSKCLVRTIALLVAMALPGPAFAQTATDNPVDVPLSVGLVLTKELCSTVYVYGKEKFEVGEPLCSAAKEMTESVFVSVVPVQSAEEPSSPPWNLVLEPRFIELGATRPLKPFAKREIVVFVEWTAKDTSGKTLWVQTVDGTGQGGVGNAFTQGKQRRKILKLAIDDLMTKAAESLRCSRELLQKGKAS